MPTPLQEGRATRKVTFTVDSATTDSRHNATDYVKGNQVATGAPRPCTPDPSRCPTSRSAGVVTLSGATTPVGRDQSGTEWRLREASTSRSAPGLGPTATKVQTSVPQACTLSRPCCRRADDPACGRSWPGRPHPGFVFNLKRRDATGSTPPDASACAATANNGNQNLQQNQQQVLQLLQMPSTCRRLPHPVAPRHTRQLNRGGSTSRLVSRRRRMRCP